MGRRAVAGLLRGRIGNPSTVSEFGDERERDREPGEQAADATEETRRRAAEEGRTIEDQDDPLAVDDDEGDGEVTAF